MPREIAYNWLDRPAELSAQEALFVARLQANEDAAYDELVRVYSTSIYHVAFRMLGDASEASDVVQEIFLKVFRNIGGFKGEAALKTWIFKIAFSEILNRLRWWKRRHRGIVKYLEPPDVLVDAMRGRFTTWTRIRVNLEHVPEEKRPEQEPLEVDYDPWKGLAPPRP